MRVNHAGEVSAQALYQGQGITARDPVVREKMQQSADEEIDHLVWCRERLGELGSRTSYLDPLWYLGSFSLGALAGLCGDALIPTWPGCRPATTGAGASCCRCARTNSITARWPWRPGPGICRRPYAGSCACVRAS